MKVASFIIATLFIPHYPTNLVITTSPRDIGVRFHPPPLIMTVINGGSLGVLRAVLPSTGASTSVSTRRSTGGSTAVLRRFFWGFYIP